MSTGADRAYAELRTSILSGTLKPGDKLNETALGERLNMSRTPVREALRRLDRDGLVEIEANRGARVIRWTPDDLREVFGLRAVLEGYAAARAAELRTPEQLAVIEQALGAMDDLGSARDADAIERRTAYNSAFHSGIVAASASPRLSLLLQQLVSVNAVARNFGQYSEESLARSQRQHHDIARAVRAGNTELARAAMTTHLLTAAEVLADLGDG